MTGRKARSRVENLTSAGGVVYRRVNGRIEAVLCGRSLPSNRGISEVTAGALKTEEYTWSLAKGTPDQGETLEETALREVREETGLEVDIAAPLGTIEYWFHRREFNIRYHKTVVFYLMVPVGGGIELHDPEFDVVHWFPTEEAFEVMTYPNEADVLRRALELISKR